MRFEQSALFPGDLRGISSNVIKRGRGLRGCPLAKVADEQEKGVLAIRRMLVSSFFIRKG